MTGGSGGAIRRAFHAAGRRGVFACAAVSVVATLVLGWLCYDGMRAQAVRSDNLAAVEASSAVRNRLRADVEAASDFAKFRDKGDPCWRIAVEVPGAPRLDFRVILDSYGRIFCGIMPDAQSGVLPVARALLSEAAREDWPSSRKAPEFFVVDSAQEPVAVLVFPFRHAETGTPLVAVSGVRVTGEYLSRLSPPEVSVRLLPTDKQPRGALGISVVVADVPPEHVKAFESSRALFAFWMLVACFFLFSLLFAGMVAGKAILSERGRPCDRGGTALSEPLPEQAVSTEDPGVPGGVLASASGERILVVGGECSRARALLSSHGYSVVFAGSAQEGLLAYTSHPGPIHLVVLDGVAGDTALAESIRKANPWARVLVVRPPADDGDFLKDVRSALSGNA